MAKKEFLGIVPGEWRHASDLRAEARTIRANVSKFNDAYGTDEKHRDYILSGNQGYRMTRKLDEIEEQLEKDHMAAIYRLIQIEDRMKNLKKVKEEKLYKGRGIK